jgi:hypothetical protein
MAIRKDYPRKDVPFLSLVMSFVVRFFALIFLFPVLSWSASFDPGWHMIGGQSASLHDFLLINSEVDLVLTYENKKFLVSSRVSQPTLTSLPILSILTSSNGYWVHGAALFNFEQSSDFSGVDLVFDTNVLPDENSSIQLYYSTNSGDAWISSSHTSGATSSLGSNLVNQTLRWSGLQEFEGIYDARFRLDLNSGSEVFSSYTSDIAVNFLALPEPPTNISFSGSDGFVEGQFLASVGSTSVNLYRATMSGLTPANFSTKSGGVKTSGVSSPLTVSGLSNGTTYFFILTGVNSAGEGDPSSEFNATPLASGNAVVGQTLVNSNGCLSCHNTDSSFKLAPGFAGVTNRFSDDQIKSIIQNGREGMPRFSFLTDTQITDIIAYFNTL